MVVHAPQVVVLERRERPIERQDLEAVLRQLELADDLRPEQRDHVRRHAESKAGENLLRYRGSAEHMAPFEHDDLEARARQIGGGDQAIVPAADHHGVVDTAAGQSSPIIFAGHARTFRHVGGTAWSKAAA